MHSLGLMLELNLIDEPQFQLIIIHYKVDHYSMHLSSMLPQGFGLNFSTRKHKKLRYYFGQIYKVFQSFGLFLIIVIACYTWYGTMLVNVHQILFSCACFQIHDPLQAFKLIKNYVLSTQLMACPRFHAQITWFVIFEAHVHHLQVFGSMDIN